MRRNARGIVMRVAALTIFGAVAGAAIGQQVGVVGLGDGIDGPMILGPLGAVAGFLTGLAVRRT